MGKMRSRGDRDQRGRSGPGNPHGVAREQGTHLGEVQLHIVKGVRTQPGDAILLSNTLGLCYSLICDEHHGIEIAYRKSIPRVVLQLDHVDAAQRANACLAIASLFDTGTKEENVVKVCQVSTLVDRVISTCCAA
jgi:hypothetical protein